MKKSRENADKNSEEFNCETCDFKCCKLSNWVKHIETRKHLGIKKMEPEKNAKRVT